MARMTKEQKALKAIDKQIEQVYYRKCSGIQINIMDITKVFKEGRRLIAESKSGEELDAAILSYVQSIAHG